jgi:RNA polymerase sigma factor (sigma-70 family)
MLKRITVEAGVPYEGGRAGDANTMQSFGGEPLTDRQSATSAEVCADSITVLAAELQAPLRAYLRRLLPQEADVEDVLQETWARVLGKLDHGRDESSLRAFVFRVATNVAFDRMRRRKTRGAECGVDEAECAAGSPLPEELVDLDRQMGQLQEALAQMSARCRTVFLLRAREQLAYDDIAERLGLGKRTVERAMREALDLCQRKLKGYRDE